MANREELKTMIKCFRVHELQLLLSFAGRSRNGKKHELQERVLSLLKLQPEPLAIKIKHLYNSMNGSVQRTCSEVSVPASSTSGRNIKNQASCNKEEDGVTIVNDLAYCDRCTCNAKGQCYSCINTHSSRREPAQSNSLLQLALNPLYYPDHPEVKLKKLPFYKVLHEVIKPSCLVSKDYHIQQKSSFMFYLTPQQASAICLSKEGREVHPEAAVQGQLRFSLLDTTSRQSDCFPDGLIVRVNNKFCNIQDLPKKKNKDVYTKEPSQPINITPLMKFNSTEANKIDVQWNSEYGLAYILAVFLVQKKTSEDLLNRLKAKAVRDADHTKRMIEEKLNEDADSDIVTTSLRVSLMCPLGKMRLKFPCRASTCQHLQCFDASLFLQMNEKKPTWICPVCDNPAEYDKLFLDGYFESILSCERLPSDVNEIEVHSDGSWSSVRIKIEENISESESFVVKEEQEDIIDIIDDPSGTVPHTNANLTQICCSKTESAVIEKRKVDEIDLTISDSDDEPLIYYKRRGLSTYKKSDATFTSNSLIDKPPTVIQLDDSDSSDSLALMISNSIADSNTSGVADLSSVTDLREDPSTGKTSDSIMPWFTESAVFF
ncbi:hypothetical protein RUM44_003902 [Polyplax serrata]|uniref:E3 SUMO-protein ligase PIAS2 n=1 Tax=Polyplax serrata TaxID=468196 RepID=A0ABR1B217_POLSC